MKFHIYKKKFKIWKFCNRFELAIDSLSFYFNDTDNFAKKREKRKIV